MNDIQALEKAIAETEARLTELKARMPAHSIPPALIAQLDELDEQLAALYTRLEAARHAHTGEEPT